jgi:hypothetical protein
MGGIGTGPGQVGWGVWVVCLFEMRVEGWTDGWMDTMNAMDWIDGLNGRMPGWRAFSRVIWAQFSRFHVPLRWEISRRI